MRRILFFTLGDDSVIGEKNLYYDGKKSFKRTDPYTNCGNMVANTNFFHGQYQIGPFERVVHCGHQCNGPRVLMSYFLNEQMLQHFRKYGGKPYDEQLAEKFK